MSHPELWNHHVPAAEEFFRDLTDAECQLWLYKNNTTTASLLDVRESAMLRWAQQAARDYRKGGGAA